MVRETRHLWVGNLPENIREDRIREHFKRYGRVQSVKLLPRAKEEEGSTGLCATVAFMDIKSASKAHNVEQKLDERCLSTEYYEPQIPGSSSAPLYVAPRFPHGVPEEHANFDRTSLFYERGRDAADAYLRRPPPPPPAGYHVTGDPLRGRGRERLYRNGPLPYAQIIDRPPPPHHRPLAPTAWNYDQAPPSARYPAPPPTVEPYTEERREVPPVVHKKRPKSRSGSESGSNSASSRSRSRSHSRSSSSSSNSRSSSCTSGTSSPLEGSPHSSRTTRSGRVGGVAVQSTVILSHPNASPAVHSEDRRPLAICVRNLPIRSSDTSLKDGLFHEYKKHGKVTWVKVVGQGTERYALVCFKKPEDVEKALEVSHDKLFFGCKIEVASYQGYDVDDNESRPYEAELDEYHPKATRTLFIGNLEKDVTASELRKHFEQFGEIIEIDIKKQGAVSSYAFCQYADIASVVKAMRTMDGEHLGNNRIKLGFGKSMPTNCVWVDGVADNVSEKYLNLQFNQFGSISHVTIDRERGHALIYFEQIPYAQEAVRDMRGVTQRGRKLQVDFASRECQETFYEHLEKQGHAVVGGERPWDRYDNNREVQASRFETTVVVPGARFTRYEAGSAPGRPRPPGAYVRAAPNTPVVPGAAVAGATPTGATRGGTRGQRIPGQRYAEYYDAEYPERRYSRNYDEVSQGSPGSHEDVFDHTDYGYCPRTSPSAAVGDRSVAVVADKAVAEDDGYKRLQSVVVTDVISPPLPPPDMRHLQKERVHLLEQLEECPSSGDDDVAPKKRPKIVEVVDATPNTSTPFAAAHPSPNPTLPATHPHRKSVSEVRRLSDASLKHCPRRPSTDAAPICKRRKTGSSASEGEDRCRKHHHHHHHQELESVDGSRPGTPLCDERPENLLPPSEPRRPRDRAPEGPLSLPLPRFASQVLTQRVLAGKPIIVSPPALITSPRVMPQPPPPSPTPAPPPSSPPPRPPSLPSSSSSDSELGPTLEERIRSLDEKYEKWSGSRNIPAPSETLAKLDAAGDRFRFRHKLIDINELKPSDIVKSLLAKPSVFDEDSKRLENVGDKYEAKEFAAYKGPGCFQSLRIKTECGTPVKALPASPAAPLPPPPLASPTPAAPSPPVATPGAKGLQYPFPSHPPVVLTTPVSPVTTHVNDPRSRPPAKPHVPINCEEVVAPTTPLVCVAKKTCPTTVAPTLPPRISTAGIMRPVVVAPPTPAQRPVVPGPVAKAAPLSSPKIYKDFGVAKPETLLQSTNIPPTAPPPSESSLPPGLVPRVGAPTAAVPTATVVTSSVPVVPVIVSTPSSSTTIAPTSVTTHSDQSRQKAKVVASIPKPLVSSSKKESVQSFTPKKEDAKISSGHRSKSLEEKKEKKESSSVVCQRRESEGMERREKKREKEAMDAWDNKRKEKDLEERRKEWDPAESEREKKKECSLEKDVKNDSAVSDRLGWSDKDASDNQDREKVKCEDSVDKKKDFADERWRDNHPIENVVKERWKEKEEKRKENHVDHAREKELNRVQEVAEKRKETDQSEHLDRRKDLDHPNEVVEKRKEKDSVENSRRKSVDNSEKRKNRESPENVERRKDREQNHVEKRKEKDVVESVEKKKDRDSTEVQEKYRDAADEKRKDRESEEKRKERRRDRAASVNSPAAIGGKRRISSQDSLDNDEAKRPKLAERRDSKDSGRSSSSSSKRGPHHSFAKPHDDKTKQEAERKQRHEHDKIRDKSKKKNRELLKPGKESVDERETSTSPRLIKRKEDSDSDKDESSKHRHKSSEKKKMNKEDFISTADLTDEKARSAKKDREKRGSSEKRKEDSQSPVKDDKLSHFKKESRLHKMSNSDTDSDDEDGPKKHSIFDIVDDGPAYISMYDKVKARSTKNMQKQEEEKRQEKMREKFSLLKASRAKREEKKRSTSWDEDSDSDMDPEVRRAKRAGKPVISSSSEDESRRRASYDGDMVKSLKKEDLGLGDSDSDSHHRKAVSESDGNTIKHLMTAMRKGSRAKLISDTSDDDIHAPAFKPNNVSELYSAESDADLGFADSDDRHPTYKKTPSKNHKLAKSVMDSLSEESIRKPILDITKCIKEKNASFKKTKSKSLKGSQDWSDEEKGKIISDSGKSNFFDEDKLSSIFKSKSIGRNKTTKSSFNSSDEEQARKLLTDAVKAEIFANDNKVVKKSNNKIKVMHRCLDSSDDELVRKLQTSTPKVEVKIAVKNKSIKSSPESHDEEPPRKFNLETEKTLFGEIPVEKYNSHGKAPVVTTFSSEIDRNSITPPQLDKKLSFFANSVEKNADSSRKKDKHKNKKKRLKETQSSEEGKVRDSHENHVEAKVKSEKKHKRERRKSEHGEDQNKINKIKKKKTPKPDTPKPESSLKRDEKMEDIFGPISDDSESGIHVNKVLPALHNNGGRTLDKLGLPDKWQVSMIYGSDSDSVDPTTTNIVPTPVRPSDKERKKRDKKRRERKAREEDSIGAELAEAGRALEAKLLGSNDYISEHVIKRDPETDMSRFSDAEEKPEVSPLEKVKEKERKKKRKKSKEEKQNKHHHHHHHDKKSVDGKVNAVEERSPPAVVPVLPSLDVISAEEKPVQIPETLTVIAPTVNAVPCKISPRSLDKKKDKFLPGFGVAMDAAIHEDAVKSISAFDTVKSEPVVKTEVTKKAVPVKEGEEVDGDEEKPRAVISQEETEDAVAALLGESFGADFTDCYGGDGNGSPHHTSAGVSHPQLQTDEEEETRQAVEGLIDMKPETPQSEPDLQIDTDTENEDRLSGLGFSPSRSSDNTDFSKPPKTPDMPASYYRQKSLEAETPAVVAKTAVTPEVVVEPPTYPKPVEVKVEPAVIPVAPIIPKPVPCRIPLPENNKKVAVVEPKRDAVEGVKDIPLPMTIKLFEKPTEKPVEKLVEKAKPVQLVKSQTVVPLPAKIPLKVVSVPAVLEKPIPTKLEVVPEKPLIPETSKESLPIPLPSVIKAPSPTPIRLPVESVIKCQDYVKKEELIVKERVPFSDNIIKDYKPYRFEDLPIKKDNMLIKDENIRINDINFGRLDKSKETENNLNQEDDFSEPETDLKSESDIVTNLLKSDSLTRGLSIDDSTPETEKPESTFDSLIAAKVTTEAVSVIKEIESRRLPDIDPFSGTKQTKDALTLHKENHSNFMSDVIRADTGFWSTKEVNIDSVIKKVDALCSAEEDAVPDKAPWGPSPIKEEIKSPERKMAPSPVEIKESAKVEEVEVKPKVEVPEPVLVTPEKETENLEVPKVPERAQSEDRLSTLEAAELTPESAETLHSGSSPEDDLSEPVTPRGSQRGRRGVGGRRRTPSRATANVTTRRTRMGQAPPDGSPSPVSPRRGGRPPKSGRAHDPGRIAAAGGKLAADVYEFHDDSDDEGGGRPRLVLTIKSPAAGELPQAVPSVMVNAVVDPEEDTATAPAGNTRKSRRLQVNNERDGSRSNVDDTIEDVVRGAAILTRAASARRQAKQINVAVSPRSLEPRKSPRGGKRQTANRTSESQDELEPVKVNAEELAKPDVEVVTEPVKIVEGAETKPVVVPPPGMMLKPRSEEPMTLIDPVTGLLTPMRESEEGQYIPVTSAGGRSQSESIDSGLLPLSRVRTQSLTTAAPISASVVAVPLPETKHLPPVVQPAVAKTTQVTATPAVPVPVKTSVPTPPAVKASLPTPSVVKTPVPTPAVLKAVVPTPALVKTPVPTPALVKTPVPTPAAVKTPVPTPALVKTPVPTPASAKTPVPTPALVKTPVPTPAAVKMPVPTPTAVKTPVPTPAAVKMPVPTPALVKTVAPKTPVPSLPVNLQVQAKPQVGGAPSNYQPVNKMKAAVTPMSNSPKPHHLQTAVSPSQAMPQHAHMNKVMLQHPGVANPASNQKPAHMLQAPRPASPAVHATASPPKAHQGLGPPPILTGAVASPPLKSSQQPIVTGASSSRTGLPKAQVPNLPTGHLGPHTTAKGMMIAPKVEVSMGGCIVVPSASPQPRTQVMQAGMPVPAYEASLGEVVQHVFPHSMRGAPHEMSPHYVHQSLMYQQYLRAGHIPYHIAPGGVRSPMMPGLDAKLESDPDSAPGGSPPLELRRPLPSPHDRLTDSPQVAQVYMHGSRLPHYAQQQPRYYETEPPPAHVRGGARHLTEAPTTQPMMQVATPPHASQVPPQADSLLMLLQRYPVMWQGLLALKNDQAAVQMHFVFGNPNVARDSLPCNADGSTAPLRIAQRMRLEQTQVEGVARKMQMDNEHCMLLALPCGRDHMDVLQQSNNLQTGFITYLQQKQAAGIVNIAGPGTQQAAYVVHIFPSCDFANENLARIAPDLLHRVADIAHLLVVIATV